MNPEEFERIKQESAYQEKKTIRLNRNQVIGKEDMNNLPRHKTNCHWFQECPIDYKCRAYDPKYLKCVNCKLHEEDGICHKKELHTETILSKMITRPYVDLDETKEKREAHGE